MEFHHMLFPDATAATGHVIAIMGGGGKTALMHRLGDELAPHLRTLLTSLTKAGPDTPHPVHWLEDLGTGYGKLDSLPENPLYLMGYPIHAQKAQGLTEPVLAALRSHFQLTVFECDGARKRPLKIHSSRDPEIPAFATDLIIVVGADVVDTSLDAGRVHRPEQFAAHWSLDMGARLTPEFISLVLTSEQGYLSKVPARQPRVYFINKADRHPDEARRLAGALADRTGQPCCLGSMAAGFWEWAP